MEKFIPFWIEDVWGFKKASSNKLPLVCKNIWSVPHKSFIKQKFGKIAIIIVDVQKDFCPGGALAVIDGHLVILPLNELIKLAEENGWMIIYSRDWHPKETDHFKKWVKHCMQNTVGAKFHKDLFLSKKSVVISKGTGTKDDGYSAFEGTDLKSGKSLLEILNENNIQHIFVGGLATDYCVKATALDSRKYGFNTFLVQDAVKAVNIKPKNGDKAIKKMQQENIILINSQQVLNGMEVINETR